MHKKTNPAAMLILGAGPAGYAAAIYGARAGLSPVLLTGLQPGGQLELTTDVENYPGFADIIQGPWLMEQMKMQAQNVGTHIIQHSAAAIDLSERPFQIDCDDGEESVFYADSLIVATGAVARWLGIPGEKELRGAGVSACATCDGFFFRGREVCVIGGGNTAVEEALYLTRHASKVWLIHRRDSLRAEKILQNRLFANEKISCLWCHEAVSIESSGQPLGVCGINLRDTRSGAITQLGVDGVFVAIGHEPATKIFRNQLAMDKQGYILTESGSTCTSVAGVFAAGDVSDRIYRQAVTAAGTGCMAALDAEKFLAAL